MLAQNNDYLKEAVSGVRQLTEDDKIRQQCQAREDFAYWERIRNNRMKELNEGIAQTKGELQQAQDELQSTKDDLQQTQGELQQAQQLVAQKDAELAKALARIAELEGAKN